MKNQKLCTTVILFLLPLFINAQTDKRFMIGAGVGYSNIKMDKVNQSINFLNDYSGTNMGEFNNANSYCFNIAYKPIKKHKKL